MKMAKASEADLDMAMELCGAMDALTSNWPTLPTKLCSDPDKDDSFDRDDDGQCGEVLRYLLSVADRASLMRVVFGCAVMLDPRNELVDPEADTIEHHPRVAALHARVAELEAALQRLAQVAVWDDDTDRDEFDAAMHQAETALIASSPDQSVDANKMGGGDCAGGGGEVDHG